MNPIPERIKSEEFKGRLVRVKHKEKNPFDMAWNSDPKVHFSATDPEFIQHIEKYLGNYGILTGDGLIVIDCDKPKDGDPNQLDISDYVRNHLPQTLEVRTGGGGTHFYYKCDLGKKFVLIKEKEIGGLKAKIHYGEVQTKGQHVIGAGSTHANGNKYAIIRNEPIAALEEAELKATLAPYYEPEELGETRKTIKDYEPDPIIDAIKAKLTIKDILEHYHINTKTNPCMCPLGHPSEGGKCLSYTDSVWFCFHCNKYGNLFQLIEKKEGCKFPKAKEIAMELSGVSEHIHDIEDSALENILDDDAGIAVEKFHSILISKLKTKDKDTPKNEIIKDISNQVLAYLLNNYKFYTVYVKGKEDSCWVYDDGVVNQNGTKLIKKFTQSVFLEHCNNHLVQEMIGHIYRSTSITSDEFTEPDKNLLCMENGIYNLETAELTPHSDNYIFFNKLPISFDPSAKPQESLKFMQEVLEPADIDVAQELFGYCLWRDYEIQKFVFLLGYGANGKSVFSSLLRGFLGENNVSSVSIQDMEKNRFKAIQLRGKLLNINPDISGKSMESLNIIKTLTGRESISAESKGKDSIEFQNHAKLVFGANEAPAFKENTDAVWRRVKEIDFNNKYLSPKDYEPEKDKPNVFLADPQIIKKISTPEEYAGLFNWAVIGLKRLLNKGEFSNAKTMNVVREAYLHKSDSFRAFAQDYIEEGDFEDTLTKHEVRNRYNKWCKRHNIKKVAKNTTIKEILSELFSSEGDRNSTSKDYVWTGIKWIKEMEDTKKIRDIIQEVMTEQHQQQRTEITEEEVRTAVLEKNDFDPLDISSEIHSMINSGDIHEIRPKVYNLNNFKWAVTLENYSE